MILNSTSVPGNYTTTSSSSTGLSVGLTLFFLLLVIVAAVIVYKYHSVMWNMLPFGQRKTDQKEEKYTETPQDDSNHYTSMIRDQSTGQQAIYENLTTTAGCNRSSGRKGRLPGEHEEDVYLQCDTPDDAIYSNDPACNLSILPDSREEDVYIVPDS